MSGLREAFDRIVVDVPVYGDLDWAIEQADRERRNRYGTVVGLAAAAVVLMIAGIVAVSGGTDAAPPVSPSPTAVTPSPTPAKTQSPETWADTPVSATYSGPGWQVPDPLEPVRRAWFHVVVEHLDPRGEHLKPTGSFDGATGFVWPADLPDYGLDGHVELVDPADQGARRVNGCQVLLAQRSSDGRSSCSGDRIAGPDGERARIFRYQRLCGSWDPGREGDDARPGPGSTYATCGDYAVAVTVERRDGLVGSVVVNGRGTVDYNPYPPKAMVAVAADPRLTLPEAALDVPSDRTVASVLDEHVPGLRSDDATSPLADLAGHSSAWGRLGRLGVSVSVRPAAGSPRCGRRWLVKCVERHVFGAGDPTTVFVGAWEEKHFVSYPKSARADSRRFVYVGPRNTVVVGESMVVKVGDDSLSADLDQRLIDLALDPRLQ